MQTFDQHLADLVRSGEVTYEVALGAATRPSDFALQFKVLGAPSGGAPRGAPAQAAAPAATPAVTGLTSEDEYGFLTGAGSR
jgi:twitching motility protein PilT